MTTLFRHASQLVGVTEPDERRKSEAAMRSPGVVEDGAVVVEDGRITWVGPTRETPPLPANAEIVDCHGRVVLPAFVDSHTHLLFAGSREDEFEQRLQGHTYQEIAAAGGGILSTVRRVRLGAASADHLLCVTDAGIEALAASEVVATLLPRRGPGPTAPARPR